MTGFILRHAMYSTSVIIVNLTLVLMLRVQYSRGSTTNCHNKVDMIFAVDTTSSHSNTEFQHIKEVAKNIAAKFTIGKAQTRFSLISIAQQARLIANFDQINSLADFNSAVDLLTYSTDNAMLSEGIRLAKNSALNTARMKKTTKVLMLIKDRRLGSDPKAIRRAENSELSRITSEAASVKSIGAAVHAVGIGGLWDPMELQSLFGNEYLLFKFLNAIESIKALNNPVCGANCPRKGKNEVKKHLCYKSTRHVVRYKIDLIWDTDGESICRTEIERGFETCHADEKCDGKVRNKVSSCGKDDKVEIRDSWQIFSPKRQSCEWTSKTSIVNCFEAWVCSDQVADVIFLLDRSNSIGKNNFWMLKNAVRVLIDVINIGVNNVRVGVASFSGTFRSSTFLFTDIQLGEVNDKQSLILEVKAIKETIYTATRTDLGLQHVRQMFKSHGRQNVAKYVFVLTDGMSDYPDLTMNQVMLLKNDGATIYAVGISNQISRAELDLMTAPESHKNVFVGKSMGELKNWAENFSKKLCLHIGDPLPALCDDSVFTQTISKCIGNKQQISSVKYTYSKDNKCIKTYKTIQYDNCRPKICTSPTDGNEYFEEDRWTHLCHEFQCGANTQQPFLPTRSKCMASDGSCKGIGSPPFSCFDDEGSEVANCKCVSVNGSPVTIIENY